MCIKCFFESVLLLCEVPSLDHVERNQNIVCIHIKSSSVAEMLFQTDKGILFFNLWEY